MRSIYQLLQWESVRKKIDLPSGRVYPVEHLSRQLVKVFPQRPERLLLRRWLPALPFRLGLLSEYEPMCTWVGALRE
jgi:hypothetical protein